MEADASLAVARTRSRGAAQGVCLHWRFNDSRIIVPAPANAPFPYRSGSRWRVLGILLGCLGAVAAQSQPTASTPSTNATLREFYFQTRGIDQGLADGPYLGTAVPIHGPVTPGNTTWFSREAPQYPLDRAKAKELLASVALADRDGDGKVEDPSGTPARFSILTQAGHLRERAATYLQDQLRQVGLTVDIVTMDAGALFGRFAGDLSMNPACTLATNLVEGKLSVLPAYALGTTAGCFLGFLAFARFRPRLDRWLPGVQ